MPKRTGDTQVAAGDVEHRGFAQIEMNGVKIAGDIEHACIAIDNIVAYRAFGVRRSAILIEAAAVYQTRAGECRPGVVFNISDQRAGIGDFATGIVDEFSCLQLSIGTDVNPADPSDFPAGRGVGQPVLNK